MRTIRIVQTATMVLGMVGVVLSADATQSETIHGNECQNVYPPDVTNMASGLYHNTIGIHNNTSVSRFIECPIHRIQAQATTGWQPAVVASDSTGKLICAGSTFDEFGNTVLSVAKTIPAGSGPKLINWSTMPSPAWAYFSVSCTMPSASTVLQVLYEEF